MDEERKDEGGAVVAIVAGCLVVAMVLVFTVMGGLFWSYRSLRVKAEEKLAQDAEIKAKEAQEMKESARPATAP